MDLEGVTYPKFPASVPPGSLRGGRYRLRFASSTEDLRKVQRLRFEVFNLELEEGLDSAFDLGRDEDEFDANCHHLMVEEAKTDRVVGTYRFMTQELAEARGGFYSETEFDFADLPADVQRRGVEIGRACVAAEHRSGRVIHLLWKGLARYLAWNEKRYLFGCASIPSMDPAVGEAALKLATERGQVSESIRLTPLPKLRMDPAETTLSDAPDMPPLLESYLRLGARICSAPALDRAFKVIDFFVVLDLDATSEGLRKSFFGKSEWSEA
ncbi:MAG: GNAT family N-acyltransferase [Myxococcota bacterium]